MIIKFFKKPKTRNEEILEELKAAHLDLTSSRSFFNSVKDPDLIDYAIFKLEAAESKYSYFLKQAKERNIKCKRAYNV